MSRPAPTRRRRGGLAAALLAAAVAVAGCAVQSSAVVARWPADLPAAVELDRTPFFPQTAYHCGPAALATAAGAVGVDSDPEVLAKHVFLPSRKGTLQVEMLGGTRREGLVATRIPGTVEAVLREIAAGNVVVVLQNLGLDLAPVWHYAVVVGYDRNASEVVLRSGTTRREAMPLRTFEHTWQRAGSWGFVALPPGRWPVTATETAAVEGAVGFERAAPPAMALRAYASAVQRWPDNLPLAIGLGNAAHASGQLVLAADAFSDAATRRNSAPAWVNLARTLIDAGHPQAALDAATRAAEAPDPDGHWRAAVAEARVDALRAVENAKRPAARRDESERNAGVSRSSRPRAVR